MSSHETPLTLVKLAVGVFITIGIVSLAIMEYSRARDVTLSAQEGLESIQKEWDLEDLAALCNQVLNGEEVKQLTLKYKKEFPVKVGIETFNSASALEESSKLFKPDAYYSCNIETQINGAVKQLEFNSIDTGPIEGDTKLMADLRKALEDAGISSGGEASELITSTKEALLDLRDIKAALGSVDSVDKIQGWKQEVASYKDELSNFKTLHNRKVQNVSVTSTDVSVAFQPEYIIVTRSGGVSGDETVLLSDLDRGNTIKLDENLGTTGDVYLTVTISENKVTFTNSSGVYTYSILVIGEVEG